MTNIKPYYILVIGFLIGSLLGTSCSSMLGVSESTDENSDRRYEVNNQMPSEPGKCYTKCLIPDSYKVYEEEVLIYTGDNVDQEGVEFKQIVTSPATTKWEKRKADRNCMSADPNDCLVWCMVDVPEEFIALYIVQDTTLIKDYRIDYISYEELERPGGFTEWREVLCEADATEDVCRQIQLALIAKGFGNKIVPNGRINTATKEALVAYQKAVGLPVGNLNLETLDSLEVDY